MTSSDQVEWRIKGKRGVCREKLKHPRMVNFYCQPNWSQNHLGDTLLDILVSVFSESRNLATGKGRSILSVSNTVSQTRIPECIKKRGGGAYKLNAYFPLPIPGCGYNVTSHLTHYQTFSIILQIPPPTNCDSE